MAMTLIAVTSGTGTLGQNLVPAALARGHGTRASTRTQLPAAPCARTTATEHWPVS
jgi:uncharacterized protein YbjT (DUF2867 family)